MGWLPTSTLAVADLAVPHSAQVGPAAGEEAAPQELHVPVGHVRLGRALRTELPLAQRLHSEVSSAFHLAGCRQELAAHAARSHLH